MTPIGRGGGAGGLIALGRTEFWVGANIGALDGTAGTARSLFTGKFGPDAGVSELALVVEDSAVVLAGRCGETLGDEAGRYSPTRPEWPAVHSAGLFQSAQECQASPCKIRTRLTDSVASWTKLFAVARTTVGIIVVIDYAAWIECLAALGTLEARPVIDLMVTSQRLSTRKGSFSVDLLYRLVP